MENLPVFPGQLYIFYGEQHIQTLVQHLFSIELLRFSLEKCMYSYPCKSCYTISRGSWPSWYLSLGLRIPTEVGVWSREFSGYFVCFMSLLYLLRTLWDLREDRIFRKWFGNPKSLFSFRCWSPASSEGKWWWNEVIKGVDLNLTARVWILVSFLWTIVFLGKLLNLSDSVSSFVK